MSRDNRTTATHWRQIILSPGQKFGRLTVVDGPFLRASPSVNRATQRQTWYLCCCDCGKEHEVRASHLTQGKTKSCGCLSRDTCSAMALTHNIKHGASRDKDVPEYHVWSIMRSRCRNPRDRGWHHYGGRGITVCERWERDFSAFLADMGRRPSPRHQIDRIDNNLGYWCGKAECPECGPAGRSPNCRWATPRENMNNTRANVRLEHDGKCMTVAEWAQATGMGWSTIRERLKRGWTIADALTIPTRRYRGT